ncbi:hypothetical protein A2483_01700, partial [Candidatus Peregrinibacteria bacterium RIFOXYC2_FULL_33_13]
MNTKTHKQLAKLLIKINNQKIAESFLENLFTPDEIEEITQRLEILRLLNKGMTQREISKKLKVSIGTVSRGARIHKFGKPGLNQVIAWWQ